MHLVNPANAGLCRHQNLLRPSQCSTSGSSSSSSVCRHTAGAFTRRRAQLAPDAVASRAAPQVIVQAASAGSKAAAGKQPQQQWRYKYKRQPCPSLCSTDDMLCQEVEALIQNVLSFPNMPARIHRALPIIKADISSMTALVEQMARHFGKELTLCYIRKQPHLLSLDFDTVMSRCNSIRDLFGIRDSDIPQMLRKCPHLVMLDTQQARAAYDNIPRVIKFTPLQVRTLVRKYPVVITLPPQQLAAKVERLRQLCYTREEWARDFEAISPALLAYFLRDSTDQLMRLEYLASTGERPEWQLRDIMKPANRSFRSKVRNFAQWEMRVKQRRGQARAAAAAAAQQAVQQAEAAAIKAALLAAEEAEGPAQQHQQQVAEQQQVQQQPNQPQQQQ